MQKITIIGRLGRDAAIRETSEGTKIISFPVAANGRYRGLEKTSWYDVSIFNYERFKNMAQYLTKGKGVVVVGELDCDLEEGSDGVKRLRRNITADSIDFVLSGNSGNTATNETVVSDKSEIPADPKNDEGPVIDSKAKAPKKSAKPAPAPVPEEVPQGEDDLPF